MTKNCSECKTGTMYFTSYKSIPFTSNNTKGYWQCHTCGFVEYVMLGKALIAESDDVKVFLDDMDLIESYLLSTNASDKILEAFYRGKKGL